MASTSNSVTNSYPVETPQNDWQLALSQLLSNLGQQQLGWANQQFNHSQGITDSNINRYIQMADSARQQGQNLWDRYTGVFQPEENQLVQDAATYASTPRIQQNMGLAESDVGQAADHAKHNAEMQLQSFGIDPSSGRYAELEQASNAQRAAAQAGAGTQAALATQDIGRQLRGQAIQVGQQLPGESVNAMNAALGGIAGAENSILGQENVGANLMHTADPYFSDAMRLNNPPMSSHSTTTQNSDRGQDGSGAGGRGGGGGGAGSGPMPPISQSWDSAPDVSGMGDGMGSGPGRGVASAGRGSIAKIMTVKGTGGGGTGGTTTGGGGGGDDQIPYSGTGTDYPLDPGAGSQFSDPTQGSFDSSGGYSGQDYYGSTSPDQSYGFDNAASQPPVDTSGQNFPDPTGGGGTYNFGAGGDWSQDPGNIDVTDFARGGVVPTTGGHVPQRASPSRGVVEDDVPARLNADEYVIPRDVVHHQGTKFFDDLIKKSRTLRGAGQRPIGAQRKPALSGRPRFVSRPGVR